MCMSRYAINYTIGGGEPPLKTLKAELNQDNARYEAVRYVFDDPRDFVECVACGAQVGRWSALAFEGRPFCLPCATATPNPNDQGDTMPKPTPDEAAEALAVLADVDKLTTGTDRAVLTMPLTRLVDLDGTETVLAEVVVEVRLLKSGVMEALDDEDCMALAVEVESLQRQVTADGAAAIRQLAALLPPDAGR